MLELTLAQAKAIVEMFGGDEDPDMTISVREGQIGHSGPGLYAWWTDLPEEGSVFLSDDGAAEPLPRVDATAGVPVGPLGDGAERRVEAFASGRLAEIQGCPRGCGSLGQCKANAYGTPDHCPARTAGVDLPDGAEQK